MLVPALRESLALLCSSLLCHRLQRCLLLACLVAQSVGSVERVRGCRIPQGSISGLYREGDIIIGGIFPVHVYRVFHELTYKNPPPPVTCNTFVPLTFQWLQSFLLAVREISNSDSLLPNITLGVHVYDSCASPGKALEGVSWFLTGGVHSPIPNYRCRLSSPIGGIIGDSSSASSLTISRLLGLYSYPQISYFSTSSILSDRKQFPSFFRTVPSDTFQSKGLAQLVSYFGWTWVGLLAEDTDYGEDGIRATKMEILKSGSCIAFTEYILTSRPDRNAPHLSRVIAESNASVVIVFSSGSNLLPVVEELLRHNVTGKSWIASDSWSTSALVSKEKYWNILRGTIGFALHSGQIPNFKDFLMAVHPNKTPDDIFLKEFWEITFGCKWEIADTLLPITARICTGQETFGTTFSDITVPRVTYSVYVAVYALAWALHIFLNRRQARCREIPEQCQESLAFQQWEVLQSMKSVHFWTKDNREIYFDSNGNIPAVYDIVNWQITSQGIVRHVKIGSYDSTKEGHTIVVNISAIQWTTGNTHVPLSICSKSCPPGFRKAAIQGKPICCFLCVPCPSGDISNQTDSVDCLRCPWDKWPSIQQDRCLPKTIEFLSYDESLGSTLVATSVVSSTVPVAILSLFIHYKTSPIVRANNYTLSCLLLLSLSFCFLCSVTFIGYPQPDKCLVRQVLFGMVFTLCVACILAKTITVVIAFKATKPGSNLRKWAGPNVSYIVIGLCVLIQLCLCTMWLSFSPPFLEEETQTKPGVIIVSCNEGSPTALWSMLGYLGLLATISFILAFLVRRLPDSFNEAKYITFSMLAFLTVWITFIPAYLSAHGKYTVAMEIFAILSSSWALVVCIFMPKCFIIIFRPELNTKDSLMGQKKK
ncbi:extracellular calcium-sensing receptor-like [Bombina bombina]|uniref:extracellular calcium-sensing receptor-like n=1 Tax=Bombina bombina TaxID=8345 RepID=UPI00235A6687|nr:extracellular calcium-sensing receptor-like [Bombina bombina]